MKNIPSYLLTMCLTGCLLAGCGSSMEVAEVVENDVQEETVESSSEDEEISSESIEEGPTLVIPEEAPKVLSGEEIYTYISGLDNYTITSLFDSQLEKNPEESYGYESKMLVTPEIETDVNLKDRLCHIIWLIFNGKCCIIRVDK